MLMDQLRKEDGKDVDGRDIHSAFNSINTEIMSRLLKHYPDIEAWVKDLLATRRFQLQTNRVSEEATMRGGTPQGSPLSPSLVTSSFVSLQFIDDCNSITRGSPKQMDEIYEQAAEEFKLKWDHKKDWKIGVHLRVNLEGRRHTMSREGKANAAFQQVMRLTRLPPREKKKIVVSQLLPILMYGCELHNIPTARGEGYAAGWNRFITGAWRGSSRERVSEIAGIAQLGEAMKRKRIRWAASVDERGLTELKGVAVKILCEEGVELRWP